jgi:hypothetical protein
MHEMALVDSVHSDCFQRSHRTVILTVSALLFEVFVAADDKRLATSALRTPLPKRAERSLPFDLAYVEGAVGRNSIRSWLFHASRIASMSD